MTRFFRLTAVAFAAVFMLSAAFVSYSSAENFGEKYDRSLLWLEKVNGKRALNWARKQNQQTLRELTADPLYARFKKQAYAILTAPNRITYGTLRGCYVYNFWRDKKHVRGIWRRTTVARYKAGHYKWEVLLDIDALAKKQGKNWVYKGADCLAPDYNRCLISLSPGGTDATTYREFDITTKSFVKGGFQVPLSKTDLGWQDKNTLLIATDWGPDKNGVSAMNNSGYSRIVKRWHRGIKLRDAKTVLTMRPTETFSFSQNFTRPEGRAVFIGRGHDFYHISYYLVTETGDLKPLPLPEMSNLEGLFRGQILVNLKQDWRGHKAGSLVSFNLNNFRKTGKINRIYPVYGPGLSGTIRTVAVTRDRVYITGLEDVASRIWQADFNGKSWSSHKIDFGGKDVFSISSYSGDSNNMLMARDGLLSPNSLYFVNFIKGIDRKLQSLPPRFDAAGLKLEQHFATSRDGTRIPYFIVTKKQVKLDGKTPVLQYGYGGFEISILPHYLPIMGKLWLERGGAYVIANIRGGGEYGPRWHDAALRQHRQRAYDDFFAVAEAVQKSGLSSPRHYGITGRSNGGLLTGVAFTERPELFNAVISGVPLLDMKRYNKILAGASWMAEYGNPDTADWNFIKKYSPLQNLRKNVHYPPVYFYTSTKDDRVGPAHARKMAAKMAAEGHKYYYYENIEGGHKGNANYTEESTMRALEYVYLWQQLK